MKTLCLIRHAKSDWGNDDLEDIDRPLNARGYADAKTMSLRLKDSASTILARSRIFQPRFSL